MEHTYLVTLVDRTSGAMQKILVRVDQSCDIEEFVSSLTDLELEDPVVVDVDPYRAAHFRNPVQRASAASVKQGRLHFFNPLMNNMVAVATILAEVFV